jgi:hypothetical protein
MANEKNVEALRALIEEWESAHRAQVEATLAGDSLSELRLPDAAGAAGLEADVPSLWDFLTARGVLVPNALEPGDCASIVMSAIKDPPLKFTPSNPGLVRALERIAKGEG